MTSALNFLSHRIVVASAAFFLFIENAILLHVPIDQLTALFVLSVTLSAYLIPSHLNSSIEGLVGVFCFLISLGTSIWFFIKMNHTASWVILLTPVLLLTAYHLKWVKTFSLRNHPATKGLTIAVCWCCMTVWLPAASQQVDLASPTVVALTILNGSLLLAMSWLCDMADLQRDLKAGLITLPVCCGVRKTLWLTATIAVAGSLSTIMLLGLNIDFLGSACVSMLVVGLSAMAATRLSPWPAKWMVDALLLSKPIAMIVYMS